VGDRRRRGRGVPGRAAAFAVAIFGQTVAMGMLKRRLVRAEANQRTMAERDSLTGLLNRRSFDAALAAAVGSPDGAALVLFACSPGIRPDRAQGLAR
jgi:predicted signal transduction protein with EAL and GGDEF domain